MQHAPTPQTRRAPARAVAVPATTATSAEVALLFPVVAGLVLLLLAL